MTRRSAVRETEPAAPPIEPRPRDDKPARRLVGAGLALVLLFAMLALLAAPFIDEPLRQYMERQMNANLKGYTVRIAKLDFHPLGFAIDLDDWTVAQQAHPNPPVAEFERLTASVHWRALIFGRLVATFHLERPRIHVNRQHFLAEAGDEVAVEDRGWQQALEAIYPLRINEFTVSDGELTYIDDDPKQPLTLKKVDFVASNIRSIRSRERTYPSDLRFTATVFDSGKLSLDGNADFLAEPHLGLKADFGLEGMKLDYFAPVVQRYNVTITEGTLSVEGNLEYSPKVKVGALHDVMLENVAVQYANRPQRDAAVKEVAEKTQEAAKEVSNDLGILLKIDRLRIQNGDFAFVNEGQEPAYKLTLADTEITLSNLSNQRKRGTATASLKGKFMGSGDTDAKATFRPEAQGPDFDLDLQIRETDLKSLNDLFRAYGNFDVVGGKFALTLELRVRNQRIDGYIKPFFRDMDVYDRRQDAEKNMFRQAYEGLV
ncbi:MAG TPA: DUF748 domain-containing protein, partial [Candidatus Binatia bacterium]|nr:DUF748 domain-containing protein [Candidatus Binatia bacterium]